MVFQQRAAAKPLPKSRAVLETMFKQCANCLEAADRVCQLDRRKLELFLEFGDGHVGFEQLQRGLATLQAGGEELLNNYVAGTELVWPYCSPLGVARFKHFHAQGAEAIDDGLRLLASTRHATFANMVVAGYAMATHAQHLHVSLLKSLQGTILPALESAGADAGADTEAFLARIHPRNDAIANLHAKLVRERDTGKAQIQIALDFTSGSRKQADSLLRGVRRYRKKLSDGP